MKYNNMIYQDERINPILLASGIYKNFEYCIVSYGTHPCAYINVIETRYNRKKYDKINVRVHGGLSYSGEPVIEDDHIHDGWWIGWDYAHFGDQLCTIMEGHKYNVDEIIYDVKDVIRQLKRLDEHENDCIKDFE